VLRFLPFVILMLLKLSAFLLYAITDGPKDTSPEDTLEKTYVPSLKTLEEDVMEKMGIQETRRNKRSYWYWPVVLPSFHKDSESHRVSVWSRAEWSVKKRLTTTWARHMDDKILVRHTYYEGNDSFVNIWGGETDLPLKCFLISLNCSLLSVASEFEFTSSLCNCE